MLKFSSFNFKGPDDADFVQVVHTDALERGILAASGHVDFYSKKQSNDGTMQ